MNTYALEYSLNQPVAKQITVPLNSSYAVGIKLYKNGEPLSCETGELTVDGTEASGESAGYCVFALSSDGGTGIRRFDVSLDKDGERASFPLMVQQADFGYFDV